LSFGFTGRDVQPASDVTATPSAHRCAFASRPRFGSHSLWCTDRGERQRLRGAWSARERPSPGLARV